MSIKNVTAFIIVTLLYKALFSKTISKAPLPSRYSQGTISKALFPMHYFQGTITTFCILNKEILENDIRFYLFHK